MLDNIKDIINKIEDSYRNIIPGHIAITSTISNMVTPEQGNYLADFGGLGKIDFSFIL